MEREGKAALIQHLMGASHVFSTAVNRFLEGTLAEVSDGQLALSQLKLLLLIERPQGRLKVSDVAGVLGVTNAAASRAIERLVQRGLVARTTSRADRRAVDLALTARSRELLADFTEVRNRELEALLGRVSEDELEGAARLLDGFSVLLLALDGPGRDRCLRCGMHFRTGCVLRDVLGKECAVAEQMYGKGEALSA
ncbi:MAG: winged helix DNA-binding protein [Gemmatimonadetes bacterium]|nr:winged helix DNA-binding protein [Gemmatimonadota bacterium]